MINYEQIVFKLHVLSEKDPATLKKRKKKFKVHVVRGDVSTWRRIVRTGSPAGKP